MQHVFSVSESSDESNDVGLDDLCELLAWGRMLRLVPTAEKSILGRCCDLPLLRFIGRRL